MNLIKLAQVRALFGINPFRAETARALVAGLRSRRPLTAPLALLVDWPERRRRRCWRPRRLLVPLYAVFFWWSAAGPEERELLRLRVRPAVAAK